MILIYLQIYNSKIKFCFIKIITKKNKKKFSIGNKGTKYLKNKPNKTCKTYKKKTYTFYLET